MNADLVLKELCEVDDLEHVVAIDGWSSLVEALRWRPIVGFDARYRVSLRGEVRKGVRLLRPTYPASEGSYPYVNLQQADGEWKRRRLHRLVIEAFVGTPKPGEVVRHLDGDTRNNRLSNLAIGTPVENAADRKAHGRQSRAGARLTVERVLEIRGHWALVPDNRRRRAQVVKMWAEKYRVSEGAIRDVVARRTWKDL